MPTSLVRQLDGAPGTSKPLASLTLAFALSISLSPMACTLVRGEQQWPQFRGPTGQGISKATGLPLHWSVDDHVIWRQPIPGLGWSSPVVSRGRVYLTTAEDHQGGQQLKLLALDAKAGTTLFTTTVFEPDSSSPKIHGKNSHASPTAIAYEDHVYVHFGHLGTACLNRDGEILWKNSDLAYRPVHGNGGSPIVVGPYLVFSADGGRDPFIVALRRANGEVAWKVARPTEAVKKFSFSTPLAVDINGRPQVITPGSNLVQGLDAATGNEVWRVRYDGYSVIPRPVYGNGMVYIATGYDRPTVMAIRPTGQGDVTETHVAWTLRKGAPHTPSLLLDGRLLYMVSDHGVATCVDAEDGKVYWQERLEGAFSASPLLADNRIYLLSEEGECFVLARGRRFQLLAQNALPERALASPAVSGASLLIRTEKHLYRIQ